MVKGSDMDVRQIARKSRVSYSKLVRWTNGRTLFISLNDADRVSRTLTGKGAIAP